MKILLSGWFSFEQMGASAGDMLSLDVAASWLEQNCISYDIALARPFEGGVDWKKTNPADYSHVIFICGPFGNGDPITGFLEHFKGCRLIGLNLSMLDPLEDWNPFDLLLERDSNIEVRPDITFLANSRKVPVVGLILVETQTEYKNRALHQKANEAIRRLLNSREIAIVNIDTRLDHNTTGLRSAAEVESLIAQMDAVLTTRLHGTVLAIKNGVPALAIDPIAGGAKIKKQTEAIGWPIIFTADNLFDNTLSNAFDYCLTNEARTKTIECSAHARNMLHDICDHLLSVLDKSVKKH